MAVAEFTMEDLTVGTNYQIQLIGAADDRSCCEMRRQVVVDDNDDHVSEYFGRQTDWDEDGEPGPGSVVGIFTADATEQDIRIMGSGDGPDFGPPNDPGLSAYILSEVSLGAARLQAGDADQDLKFDQLDIIAALNAGKYLTGPYAAVAEAPNGDGNATLVYNPGTGELAVEVGATELTSINIDSAGAIFTGDAAMNLGGSFDNDADNNIFKATFGSSFGSLSFGNVAQTGLSKEFVLGDLTVIGSLSGGGDLGAVDLVYVPEPSSMVLAGLGLVGLIGLVRRRNRQLKRLLM